MPDGQNQTPEDPAKLYGADYYASHCGPVAYDRSNPIWASFFGNIADELIRVFRPRRVFDAGCAHGFLVEALWDRGVEAWGRDISDYAISQVRQDVRPYCAVGSLADPIDGPFDLAVSIEVLEHMPEEAGMQAIANLTRAADRIVFSSSPSDFDEPTHVNVKPALYWMKAFAEHGFAPEIVVSLPSITAYTLTFVRGDAPTDAFLTACAEVVRSRIQRMEDAQTIRALSARAEERDGALAQLARLTDPESGGAQFDVAYYLEANPDVRAAGQDALEHYATYGRSEGRFPNAWAAAEAEAIVTRFAAARVQGETR